MRRFVTRLRYTHGMASPAALPDAPPRSRWDGVRMSLAEFEALPEEQPYLEYFGGRVVQKAVAKRPHWKAEVVIASRLLAFGAAAGGVAGTEATVYFESISDVAYLVPDVAFWAATKAQGDDERSLPPTLAVEIRSRGQTLSDLFAKCRLMCANGVDVCWLVDPETREAYVFEGAKDGERLPTGSALTSSFLPGFELTLADLWAELD